MFDVVLVLKLILGIILIFEFIFVIQKPGAHVLYLGAASGTTVSHVSDIVGPVSTKS